jgi:hypothetical protein
MRSCVGSFYRNVTLQIFVLLSNCNKEIWLKWCQSYKHFRNTDGDHTGVVKDRIYTTGNENGVMSRNGMSSYASTSFSCLVDTTPLYQSWFARLIICEVQKSFKIIIMQLSANSHHPTLFPFTSWVHMFSQPPSTQISAIHAGPSAWKASLSQLYKVASRIIVVIYLTSYFYK